MFSKNRTLKRQVFIALVFVITLFLLTAGGLIVRSKILLWEPLVEPAAKEGVEQQAIRMLKELALKEGLRLVSDPEVKGNTFIATFSDQLTCLLNLEKQIGPQLASLQFILWRSKIDGKKPKTIDLRFDKPVVKYH